MRSSGLFLRVSCSQAVEFVDLVSLSVAPHEREMDWHYNSQQSRSLSLCAQSPPRIIAFRQAMTHAVDEIIFTLVTEVTDGVRQLQ